MIDPNSCFCRRRWKTMWGRTTWFGSLMHSLMGSTCKPLGSDGFNRRPPADRGTPGRSAEALLLRSSELDPLEPPVGDRSAARSKDAASAWTAAAKPSKRAAKTRFRSPILMPVPVVPALAMTPRVRRQETEHPAHRPRVLGRGDEVQFGISAGRIPKSLCKGARRIHPWD